MNCSKIFRKVAFNLHVPSRYRRVMPPEFKKQYIPKISISDLETYRAKFSPPSGEKPWEKNPKLPIEEISRLYPELVPHNLDPRYRDRLRERLERREMMLRRKHLHVPEFYVGSILSVAVADQFAPDGAHRFVGICIERYNEGLWTTFTLRNVVEKTAVEIQYELYNPTLLSIDVLLLEKRLDQNLLYLRDAALEESRVPFDMSPVPHSQGDPVPVNPKKVKLLPPPWKFQWYLHGYRGIDDSMYDYLSPEELSTAREKLSLVDRYDLMQMYKTRPCLEDKQIALGDVHLQHQDLIRYHERRRRDLIDQHRGVAKRGEKIQGTG
ncbi:unnamed protein product [Calicophoron daubneyi]|uniref:Large ribosomal subunit protein bL19m n=1 Tax=Calicophoron daubneyi TaxID=300641 RepID=A0AAV2T6G7_CALDB